MHNFTRLTTLLILFNLNEKSGWTDKSFIELLKGMLLKCNMLSNHNYEDNNIIGMDYVKKHVCPNDFILYTNEYEKLNQCPKCGESHYKSKENDEDDVGVSKNGLSPPPSKVVWYLQIIPRFKRIFVNVNDAKNIR